MYAPHVVRLWLLATLAALMIATGTLTLLAAFGAIGQLLAMLLLIYLSLAGRTRWFRLGVGPRASGGHPGSG